MIQDWQSFEKVGSPVSLAAAVAMPPCVQTAIFTERESVTVFYHARSSRHS